MFDIDNELNKIKPAPRQLSESLRCQTRALCAAQTNHAKQSRHIPQWKHRAISAVATALAVLILLVFIPGPTAKAISFYTVDINPSISFKVDSEDVVLDVSAENGDATTLLTNLNLSGQQFSDALYTVIQTAVQMSYLNEEGHVLVTHFGEGNGLSQQQAQNIVAKAVGDTVRVLAMNANKNRFEHTRGEKSSVGMTLLHEQAEKLGIEGEDVDVIIDEICEQEMVNTPDSQKDNHNNNEKDKEKDNQKDKEKDNQNDKNNKENNSANNASSSNKKNEASENKNNNSHPNSSQTNNGNGAAKK